MIDQTAKKFTYTAYAALLGLFFLFALTSSSYSIATHILCWTLYLGFCVSMFFLGSKMQLRGIGYAGLGLMSFHVCYVIYGNIFSFSSIHWLFDFIEIAGVLMFLLGTCCTMIMKILPPAYLMLSWIINLISNSYYHTNTDFVNIIFLLAIGIILLPAYLPAVADFYKNGKKLTTITYASLIGIFFLLEISIPFPNPYIPAIALCFCGLLFFFGSTMRFSVIGYAGIGIMAFYIFFLLVNAINPIQYLLYEEYGSYTGITIFSIIFIIMQLTFIAGVLLFMLGTSYSNIMKILTPAYCVLSVIIDDISYLLLFDAFHRDHALISSITIFVEVSLIGVMMVLPYLQWLKTRTSDKTDLPTVNTHES